MEILSTGEKIKRARIYKGITLKELCGDKISISKMSCIENGKIKVSEEILKYISDILEVDYNYLAQDVQEQINANLELVKSKKEISDDSEAIMKHNLSYAIEYKYYELAFEFMNKLFSYYISNGFLDKAKDVIPEYYELYTKNNDEKYSIMYYVDMANLFYLLGELKEAVSYYKLVRNLLEKSNVLDKKIYVECCIKESIYYRHINKVQEAYEILSKGIEYIDDIGSEDIRGSFYNNLGVLNIMLGNECEANEYLDRADDMFKGDVYDLASSKRDISECYFYIKNNVKALEIIQKAIDIFPKDDKEKYVVFLNKCIEQLYKYNEYSYAYEISDISLDISINIDKIELIEEAYYHKGMLLQKKGMYAQAEMYMNLSLDSLSKMGKSEEKKHSRYLDMAYMYYKLEEKREALKYFNLAINLVEDGI